MTIVPRKRNSVPLAFILDAVEYHLRPRLSESGGDLWLDELFAETMILGFRAGRLGRDGTQAWLREEIERMVPGSTQLVELKDYTVHTGAPENAQPPGT